MRYAFYLIRGMVIGTVIFFELLGILTLVIILAK